MTTPIHDDEITQTRNDENEYKSIIELLMRELIARVDAFEQHDCNDASHASLISIRNACDTYLNKIARMHA